jgi:tetratricopeptide (TPR) repeat protein
MKNLFATMFAVLFAAKIFAADVAADFSAANKLYAEGKFSAAALAYDKILQAGAQSPALLFNAGNAAFKAGHFGKAIAAYRQAERLSPRDAELRANLAFVRNQVQGTTVRESRWQSWGNVLTLNEGALVTATFFWATLALLILRQWRPALVSKLKTSTRVFAALTFLAGANLAWQAQRHFHSSVAVVTASETTARSGPFEEAQSAFTVRDGAELTVRDRHDDWVQVANGAGKIGWVSRKQVAVLPGA